MRNKSSVKTELSLRVVRKQFNNSFCVAIEFLVFVFPLNTCRMSFLGFGPSTGYKILVCLILLFKIGQEFKSVGTTNVSTIYGSTPQWAPLPHLFNNPDVSQ